MRAWITGRELYRFSQRSFGGLAEAFLTERNAKIVLRLGILRIDFGRPAQGLLCLIQFLLPELQDAV